MPTDLVYRHQMFSIVEDWKKSDQTRLAYCRAHGVNYHRFLYWHRKYQSVHAPSCEASPSFISLSLPPAAADTELIYPDGRRLLFHQGVDVAYLRALLA